MKDYSISHSCGLEQICDNLKQARAEAKTHKAQCQLNDTEQIYIDEYSHDLGELTGKYYKV